MDSRHGVLFYYFIPAVEDIAELQGQPEAEGRLPGKRHVPGGESREQGFRAGTGGSVADAGDLAPDIGPERFPDAEKVE